MSGPDQWAVWWTTSEEVAAIGAHFDVSGPLPLPEMVPEYVRDEYRSRAGRSGRGRLWVSDRLMCEEMVVWDPDYPTALKTHLERCAGIVLRAEHVERLQHLPGIVTTMGLERWRAR